MENAVTAAQTKVKKIAFRKVCFKAKPPCPVMVLTGWMQLKCMALPDVARFTRIYGIDSPYIEQLAAMVIRCNL
jgi:hypothetical protein